MDMRVAAVRRDKLKFHMVMLGCAGFAGIDKRMEKELGVPVLDGVVCALIVASGLVKYDISISKHCRYKN